MTQTGSGRTGPSQRGIPALSGVQKLARTALLAIVICVVIIGAVCVIDAVRLVGEPFPGFLVNERMIPSNFGRPAWTGPQAGLRYPDKILKANDEVIASPKDLKAIVRGQAVGTPVTYLVQRNGESLQVSAATMTFTWEDLALTFGPTFLAGILYLVIALLVYILKPDTSASWAFVLATLLIGAYQIITFDVASTHRFVRLTLLVYSFIPAAGVHLSLVFPHRKKMLDRLPILSALPYVFSAILVILMEWLYPAPAFATVYGLARAYSALAVVAVLASVLHAYFRGTSVLARQRAKVVLSGAAVAFPIPAVVNNLSLLGSTPSTVQVLSTFLPFPLLFFPASISYAIARHNLFDVDVYLKRAVGYVLMTAIVAVTYLTVQTTVSAFVLRPVFGAQAEHVYPVLFALLIVLFFNPVNQRVQTGIERLFFRKAYDYKAAVTAVSDAVSSYGDLESVLTRVIGTIRKEMFIDRAGVLLIDEDKNTCRGVFQDDGAERTGNDLCLAVQDPLLVLLAQERKLITKYDIAESPDYVAVKDTCEEQFAAIGASLTLPLIAAEKFTGALVVGYKKSGHFYTRDDIELLKTVSVMTSTAIEQARDKEQRATLMRLFSKHVSPEVADALWRQRDQFLDGGRPRSQKLIVTTLFTDLQGFSTISEKQDPEILMEWLNTYMDMVTRVVMDHGGVVDDFFGDGVKVNFGVPIPRTRDEDICQDAVNAVTCALGLERELKFLNARMAGQGNPTLRMRVGIYTGPVVAGSLGSADRMKYTTLGDTVNTAARLESFDKDLQLPHLETTPCRILIGESTLKCLGDRFITQRVGEMSLKGKASAVTAYCVLGKRPEGLPFGESEAHRISMGSVS